MTEGVIAVLCVFDRVADIEFVCSYMCLLYVCGYDNVGGNLRCAYLKGEKRRWQEERKSGFSCLCLQETDFPCLLPHCFI